MGENKTIELGEVEEYGRSIFLFHLAFPLNDPLV